MRIGIIGAGNVGVALAQAWAQRGHEVVLGLRDPASERAREAHAKVGEAVRLATVLDAASFGEVVVLATPWEGTEDAVRACGDLSGKTVFDCTNPLAPRLAGLTTEGGASGGERVAEWARGARVVKVFNTTGWNNMAAPVYGDQAATMFYSGDDASAKETAARLAADLGFDPVDAGSLEEARLLEPLALLWIRLAAVHGYGRDIAFKLLRR